MIPQGFIQDLLARVDIVDVIGRHVALKRGGQNYLGLCPFHNEKTPSFTVSASKQFFHCFGCGAHGTAIGFLIEHRGLGFVEAVRELAQHAGMQVPEDAAASASRGRARALTDLLQVAAEFYRQRLRTAEAAIDYLKGRGLSGQIAARFALGYSADAWQGLAEAFADYADPQLVEAGLVIENEGKRYDRFRGRAMFPIRNRRGAVIGFGARALDGSEPKYLNSPETPVFHKGRALYGLFEAQEAIRRKGRAIVCEGYLDVIQLAQAGFEEAVAALGTAVTPHHITELLRMTGHVIFAFDGDAAGRKAARRALEAALPVLDDTRRIEFVLLPEGEDPDSLVKAHGAEAFATELAKAMPLSRWFIRALTNDKDLGTAEGRAAFLAESKPLVQSMPAGALRLQLVRELAEVARNAPAEVESLFGLQPWRRLGELPRASRTKRSSPPDTADLKQHILQRLLSFPELAREFNGAIAGAIADQMIGPETTSDRQIAEIWRAATASAALSSGALQELLADSEFAADYRSLAARELQVEPDIETARAELAAAFAKLELRCLNGRLQTLAALAPMTADALAEIRVLSERRARLMASSVGAAAGLPPGQ